jgi:hypothetical protein
MPSNEGRAREGIVRNRFAGKFGSRGALVAWAAALGFVLVAGWPARASAVTYLCPPAPEGVYGLPGGPQFANPIPDTFGSELDDPRWNGSWREDFAATTSTEAAARILNDGTYLYFSLQAIADPDGAQIASDAVYLGFSQDGTTGILVKVVMDAAPPSGGWVNDATSVSTATWWKTTNGGTTPWPKKGPQSWATPTTIHLWTGAGTANGSAWGFNARLSLADIGSALGLSGALTGPFYMWYQIDIETASTIVNYSWPAGTTLGLNSTTAPCTSASVCAVLPVSTFGNVNPTSVANCPTGISIDPMSIGTTVPPVSGGIPGTTVYSGTTHPTNTFVAELTNTDALNPLTTNAVQGRFRISDWGSQIGMGGTWKDVATVGTPPGVAVNGVNSASAVEVALTCSNLTPTSTSINCYQLPTGAPPDQCLLVELSQNNGSGMRFVHDSARRNMDFVRASTFERSAEISLKGLAPLAGSPGTRDVYIYVRTLHLPAVTDGNHQPPVPPPVPPVEKGGDGKNREAAATAGAAGAVNQGPPRYRMSTYERIASVTPTYEVHVYHDTGRTETVGGQTRHVLEPQAPFGYFVEHAGDLSGWKHALVGEGFVLDEISPNFYHAKIPDNGSVRVHTTISSCQKHLFGLINMCGNSMAGCGGCQCSLGSTDVPAAAPIFVVAAAAMVVGRRRRRRR